MATIYVNTAGLDQELVYARLRINFDITYYFRLSNYNGELICEGGNPDVPDTGVFACPIEPANTLRKNFNILLTQLFNSTDEAVDYRLELSFYFLTPEDKAIFLDIRKYGDPDVSDQYVIENSLPASKELAYRIRIRFKDFSTSSNAT